MNRLKIIIFALLMFFGLSAFALAASYGPITVSGTAAAVYTATSAATSIGVVMCNSPASTVTVYFASDASVTSSSFGFMLTPGGCLILNGHLNSWWAVTAGTSASVSYQLLF